MLPPDRLHDPTWRSEPFGRRRELAQIDLEFCLAMGRILFPQTEGVIPRDLTQIWCRAQQILANHESR